MMITRQKTRLKKTGSDHSKGFSAQWPLAMLVCGCMLLTPFVIAAIVLFSQ